MKLLVLTAIVAVVASNPIGNEKWPWQVGKEYVYDVNTYTWTKFENSNSNGNAFKSQLVIRVQAPGHLLAKLLNPSYAQIQGVLDINDVPSDLKYETVPKLDEVFEIFVDGGRVLSLKVSSSLSSADKNILKALISALQVDLSTFGHVDNFPNSFDQNTFQGLFKKSEADVTGECETLYAISPVSVEVRRNLQSFAEDPIEITKSKNYDSCKVRVGLGFGVPEGSVWNGLAYENDERQLIKHTSESRIHAGKQGTIYKSETLDTVFVNPLLFGKQKAEVYSYVNLVLSSVEAVGNTEWVKPEEVRAVNSLLSSDGAELFFKVSPENVVNAQKVLQEITPLLENPSNLPKTEFLSKFNVLVRFIMFMDSEQLTQMTDSVEVARTSDNAAKKKMWAIYRDAVAQAGTVAAFKEIKSWILAKKIQGEEAAEVIASVPSSLDFSDKQIANEFFELAFNPEVVEQKFLNTSALLAATKFLRFGNENQFVVEKVIPRLAAELKKAIENDESGKAQVYIRSLGNLAYPDILKVFAPYFEGQVTVTKYLRTQMVISLKTLANKKNEQVRAVLFSILRNTAEPYEVRVAATLNIFLAFPTAEMMQIMAHMTNDDPSLQVRGVIATSISFAANLKDPRFAQLAKTAQAVSNIVSKEKFGYRASADSIIDDYTSNDDLAHFRELSYIGSGDSAVPKYHRTALRLRGNGLTEEDWMTWSVSDVQNLIYSVLDLIVADQYQQADLKFSPEKVAKELNIKREHDPVEGAFFIDNLNQQRLFTFGQNDLRSLVKEYFGTVNSLFSGNVNQFTKVVIAKQVVITFPLAAGFPFVYVYSEPTLFDIESVGSRANTGPFKFDVKFTYSRNLDGSVGFLDSFSGVYASSGVINKLQFFIPAKLSVTPTLFANIDLKFDVELPEKDASLIHMSVFPYTSLQKLYSALAVSEDPSTKIIERSAPVLTTDINIGESAGVSLNLKGHSYSNDFKKNIFASDILTNVRNLLYQNDIACTHFDLKYVAKDTKNKKVATTILFETLFEHKGDEELKPAGYLTDLIGNSVNRRKKLADQAASGIEYAKVRIADFSVVFDGSDKKEFVFTSALATNPLDNKVQAVIYANGCVPINAVITIIKPKTVPLNFEKALKNEIKVEYEIDFKYGNSENILFKGVGQRSKEYTERLSNDPVGKQCLQETSNKNFYQKDCYKMIIKAHAPDYFKGTVTYKELNPVLLNATYKIYNVFKHFTTWEEDEDLLKATDDGKVEIEAQAFYYDNYINYKFNTKYGEFRMNNVQGRSYYPYAMAIYAPITNWERSYNWFTGYQHLPFCTVDDNKIWTFSGRSYDYILTGSWHVAMVDESGESGNDLAILVKRPNENSTEVYVSYQNNKGMFLEIQITPETIKVNSNARKIVDSGVITYYDDMYKTPFVEYYHLPAENYQVYSLHNGLIRFMYDGHRLVIFSGSYRSTTRGLCGQSTSQPSDDYMTPYGLVDLPEHYGASFSLEGEGSDPKTVELKKEAKLKAYQPVTQYTNIFRSDDEWSHLKSINELAK